MTDGTTFASTGNFTATDVAVNDIIYFFRTSTGNNEYRCQIGTRSNDNQIIIDALNAHHGTITNEATKVYSWRVWTPKTAFSMAAGVDVDAEPVTEVIDFGYGKWFPNLAMNGLSTSVTAELYL